MTDEGEGAAEDGEAVDPAEETDEVADTAEGPAPRAGDDTPPTEPAADAGERDGDRDDDPADAEPQPDTDPTAEGPGPATSSLEATTDQEQTGSAAPAKEGLDEARPGPSDADGGNATEQDGRPDQDSRPDAGGPPDQESPDETADTPEPGAHRPGVPEDVRKYDRFQKIDGSTYDRANDFLRERTYITAREWAIARLCADFRTETGVEMTKIGENLPELVPFMTDTYSPQAVNQARAAFEEKVRKAGATFLYGAMSDFFTAEQLDDVMYEATEVAKFLLEVEGVDLTVEEELEAEDTISEVMREVREHSAALRHDEVVCPECGHHIEPEDA